MPGVVLLEEASTSAMSVATGRGPGLIFAIYLSPGDGFTSNNALGGLCTFSGNIGLEVCWLEQAWAAIVESAKVTGCVLLLGAGGLLCYRFYNNSGRRIISGILNKALLIHRPYNPMGLNEDSFWLDEEEEEEESLDLYEVDVSLGLNCLSPRHRPKRKFGRGVYIADQIRTRWRHVTRRNITYSPPGISLDSSSTSLSPPTGGNMKRYYSTPEGLVRLSLPDSPASDSRIRSFSLNHHNQRSFMIESASMDWDTMEAMGSTSSVSDLSRLIRDCSVDSDGSDFSLDVPLNEGCGLSTLRVIQRIEEEIRNLKDNCLAMNHELDTLRDDSTEFEGSNIPAGRASFKGLLNLTVIPDGIMNDSASEVSEGEDRMEWDNEDLIGAHNNSSIKSGQHLHVKAGGGIPGVGGVWGSQESGYLEWEGTPSAEASASSIVLSPLPEKREQRGDSDQDDGTLKSCFGTETSFSSCLNSPEEELTNSSTSSGIVKRRQWAEASQANRDSAIFDLGLDLEAAWREEAVGLTVQLIHYAMDTWQAPTPRAHAIQQAYIELEEMTDCRRMRRVRADHYGVLRAALCQMALKRIPIPPACTAMRRISKEMDKGSDWLRSWTFGHRLPYGPDSVLQGMAQCLETLDHTMAEILEESDPLEALVCRLNADVLLDTKMMEALKLHVLGAALHLELASSLGETLPLFALAIFARPDSKSARDLALNYLNPVGDSTTLERRRNVRVAEFYLLGYALGVRLDVYRPTAVTSLPEETKETVADLRTCYPDWDSFTRFISVIEENERHYSVPVP